MNPAETRIVLLKWRVKWGAIFASDDQESDKSRKGLSIRPGLSQLLLLCSVLAEEIDDGGVASLFRVPQSSSASVVFGVGVATFRKKHFYHIPMACPRGIMEWCPIAPPSYINSCTFCDKQLYNAPVASRSCTVHWRISVLGFGINICSLGDEIAPRSSYRRLQPPDAAVWFHLLLPPQR